MKTKAVLLIFLIHLVSSKSFAAIELMTAVSAYRNQSNGDSVMLKDRAGQVVGEINCEGESKVILLDGDTNPEFKILNLKTCVEVQQWALNNLTGKERRLLIRLNTTSLLVENIEMK
ncbi:MAG: hypothetical protein ACK5RO_12065 [Pseudobdellovibrionaceae bacterium]|jgi:hypothetical protein